MLLKSYTWLKASLTRFYKKYHMISMNSVQLSYITNRRGIPLVFSFKKSKITVRIVLQGVKLFCCNSRLLKTISYNDKN